MAGGPKAGEFQSDLNGVSNSLSLLLSLASPSTEITFMAVPAGSGLRMGVDRDEDGDFDFSEILGGSNPADPNSVVTGMPAASRWMLTLLVALAALSLLTLRRLAVHRKR